MSSQIITIIGLLSLYSSPLFAIDLDKEIQIKNQLAQEISLKISNPKIENKFNSKAIDQNQLPSEDSFNLRLVQRTAKSH